MSHGGPFLYQPFSRLRKASRDKKKSALLTPRAESIFPFHTFLNAKLRRKDKNPLEKKKLTLNESSPSPSSSPDDVNNKENNVFKTPTKPSSSKTGTGRPNLRKRTPKKNSNN